MKGVERGTPGGGTGPTEAGRKRGLGNLSYCSTSPCPLLQVEGGVRAAVARLTVRFQVAGFLCSGTARTEVLPDGHRDVP